MPYIIHDFVTQATHPEPIKHVNNSINAQVITMLTEVDILRIMAAKTQLTESVADDSEFDPVIDDEMFEMMEDDTPVSETNGLM